MNSLPQYLLTASLLLALLYLGYLLLLRNQKLFAFTRFYLLGSLLISLLHPLLPALLPTSMTSGTNSPLSETVQYLPEMIFTPQAGTSAYLGAKVLLSIYIAGCVVMALLFIIRLLKLRYALKQLHFEPMPDGFLLAHVEGKLPTFSFFHHLAINITQAVTEEEYRLILQHEKAHARQQHSADVLLVELAQVLLWFHPGIYLLNKALRQTHEHLADAAVLKASAAESTYIALMARQGLAAAGLSFTSTFFQSFTINRIQMIKKTNLRSTSYWRIAASFAFVASLSAIVACEKQQEMPNELAPPPPPALVETTQIFDVVEEEAHPVGGMQAFYEHLSNNLQYPKEAINNKVEGTAFIEFVIAENGNVIYAKTVEGRELGYGLDEAAIETIVSTKWTPAKQRGQLVKQRKILPVKFKLSSSVQ